MEVEAVEGPHGEALPFDQDVTVFEDWTLRQVTAVRVTLPAPVAPGDSIRLTVCTGAQPALEDLMASYR